METHYFQRYYQKENVATANTMLLLSRFYHYSSDRFFRFIKQLFLDDLFEPEIKINLQEKGSGRHSVPDATISQESFKIVVETKRWDWFSEDQLVRHLDSFTDEKHRLVLTLSPDKISDKKLSVFQDRLAEHNKTSDRPIQHKHCTFEEVTKAIREEIDERDYEMLEILNDYLDYCCTAGLIPNADAWKYLRVQLAADTFEINKKESLYYDNPDRGFRPHAYLGLYKNKSVQAIGKITAKVIVERTEDGTIIFTPEDDGVCTDEMKEQIKRVAEWRKTKGYDPYPRIVRYFFVDEFYDTDFKKTTKGAPMGSRIFDLTEVLHNKTITKKEKMPDVSELAHLLKKETWD